MDIISIGIFVGVLALIVGVLFLARKLNITSKEADFAKLILEVADYINSAVPEWSYSNRLSTVIEYGIMALNIAKEQENITTTAELKDFAMKQAELICALNNIEVDDDFIRLLNSIIDALIEKA